MMKPSLLSEITVKELLDRHPQLLPQFIDLGLMCPGCPAEAFHSLTDVAREYHIDLDQFLQSIVEVMGSKKAI